MALPAPLVCGFLGSLTQSLVAVLLLSAPTVFLWQIVCAATGPQRRCEGLGTCGAQLLCSSGLTRALSEGQT